jgi:predicted transcriptional regulator
MSGSPKINESPSHFMVLEAISRGMDTIDKIVTSTKLNKDEVNSIINELAFQHLAFMVEKKRFFGGKKVKINITNTGKNLLGIKHQELTQDQQKLQQLYEDGDKQQLQTYMDSNRMWMPYMLFSGLMNIVFFTSMISFLGMTMSPSESAVVENTGAESGDVGTDSSANTDGGDSQTMNQDSGTADMTDTGDMGTDMGFDGFDAGGFDF